MGLRALLLDMMPDPGWKKRGYADRDGRKLTERRAGLLSTAIETRSSLVQAAFWAGLGYAVDSGFTDRLWLVLLLMLFALVFCLFLADAARLGDVREALRPVETKQIERWIPVFLGVLVAGLALAFVLAGFIDFEHVLAKTIGEFTVVQTITAIAGQHSPFWWVAVINLVAAPILIRGYLRQSQAQVTGPVLG